MRPGSLLVVLCCLQFTLLTTVAQTTSSKRISAPLLSRSTPQGLEGGFWRTDGNFDPILRLKNVLLKQSLDVTPVLYFADGTEYDLPLMTLEPAGVAQVNIRLVMQNAPAGVLSHISSYGMAGISYKWSWPAVTATIQNTDEIASLTVVNSLRADIRSVHAKPEVDAAQSIHGTWWLPTTNADFFLVLENSSLTQKQVTVQFAGHTGNAIANQTIQLPSHGTSVVHLSSALGAAYANETAGGIQIQYSGPDHGVVTYSGIIDETVGFSASPRLFEDHLDPSRPMHQVILSAPGLLLGNADPSMLFPSGTYFKPHVILHNLSSQSRQITLTLTTASSSGTPQDISAGAVALAPGETTQLDLGSKLSQSNSLPDGYGHLTASYQGQDGDIHMETESVDQSGSYVFEVPPVQQGETSSRTICFWSIEGDNDSMIAVWNYKLTPQDLVLTLYFSGGQYHIPIHLEARQSYNLDMMSLVRSQVPDSEGNRIPDNITSGSALLSSSEGELAKISVSVTASIYNVRNATCGVQCVTCNGVAVVAFSEPAYSMPVNGTAATFVNVTMNTGTPYVNPSGSQWTSANTSIATVNSSTGVVTGVAPGSAEIDYLLMDAPEDVGQICAEWLVNCPNSNFSASPEGTGNVALCIAQLKYRSIIGGEAQHTFWYVLDASQTQYIIDGGPSGTCSPDCGYLNDWITTGEAPFGSTGIPADTTSVATWWSSPLSANMCTPVSHLVGFGTSWRNNSLGYNPVGPNSNTFANEAADWAGLLGPPWNATAPPNAVGW